MKRPHQHAWGLLGHGFGAVRRYECSSCPAIREEKRETRAESIARHEEQLGIPAGDRVSIRNSSTERES